ncbi:MAG TPA: hypothetical protein VF118_17215 [Gemmatimonadaceae bacterium]
MTIGTRRVLFGVGLVLALGLAANGLLGGASQLQAMAGATAPVVWGRTSAAIGVVSGAASAAVALGIAWLLRVGAARGAHALDSTT